MKIDIVHIDPNDPLYKVIVIDDFFDDFDIIKSHCIKYFHDNKKLFNNAFPGYEAVMKHAKDIDMQQVVFKKVIDVMNHKNMFDNISYEKFTEIYKPDILTRAMCIKYENYTHDNKNRVYKGPHIDAPEPNANLNFSQIQVLIYLADPQENFNGTNFWNRLYTENISPTHFLDTGYPFKMPITTIKAKENRCLIYYSNMPHNPNIEYSKMTTFERYTLNTQICIKCNNILNDNFNFKTLS